MGKRKRSGSFSKCDDCSKKSDDGDSQEELDGDLSAAHKGNIVNGIRYSARVQEKQEKLRREASPSKQTVADSTSTTIPAPCQSTVRAIIGDEPIYLYPFEQPFISHSVSTSGEKKKKRTWELWSQEDKQLFFEALNEYGKDFDSIQNYLASKLKPRSKASCAQAVPKNKDQVRHFYYRTWNKISKYLTFPKDMKKAYQELYGLINYGELRKKQRVLNLKTAVKLSELVERGTTTIKVRGKTFRIKTPVCRALKKLNQLDDVDHIRVPCKLCVELVPHDGSTWTSVQRVSHNPRVKVYAPLQRTLASLIIYFEERWKTDHNRLKEEFSLSMFGKPRTRLRFIPVESRDLSVPIFKFSEATSATKISLSSYVQNCLYQERKDESLLVSKKFKRKPKLDSDIGFCSGNPNNRDSDYLAAEADVSDADGCEATPEHQFRLTLRRDKFGPTYNSGNVRPELYNMDQENSNGFPDNNAMWSVHEENANAATETDVGETDYGFDENMPSPTECDDNTCDEDCMDHGMQDNMDDDQLHQDQEGREDKQSTCAACNSPEVEECGTPEKTEKQCTCGLKKVNEAIRVVSCPTLDAETIAKGWNAEEAGALTLGEIYLTLGKCDKLSFEYMWDKCEEDKLREERARSLVTKLVSVARHLKKRKTNRAKTSAFVVSTPTSGSHHVCPRCNHKTESPSSADYEQTISDRAACLKDRCESPDIDSPPRVGLPPPPPSSDENKITLHAVSDASLMDPTTEGGQNDVATMTVVESNHVPNPEAPAATLPLTIEPELEAFQSNIEDLRPAPGLLLPDSIISSVPQTPTMNIPSVTSIPPCAPSQGGLIDIATLATNSPTLGEVDSRFRRGAGNITATILPPPPTIMRAVTLTNSSFHDIQKTTLCSTLTPVTATTAVLVSEPALFASITAEAPSFVTLQPCSTTTVLSSPLIAPKPQETKFRRPADIPVLIKPRYDEQSTNEDGSLKLNVPKPFLDLPKGNRRIGRRPAWKQRVIIPRMLPLLPKPPDDSLLKSATMGTLIAIPSGVATGLGVIPVSSESLSSLSNFSICSEHDTSSAATMVTSPAVSHPSTVTITVSSISTPSSSDKPTVTFVGGTSVSVSGATTSIRNICTADARLSSPMKTSPVKNCLDMPSSSSSRTSGPGFEETLDNLSLSSFMDISIPESTRFLASDLRLEELECSNTSISLSGILDDSSNHTRKNTRDPPLLDTPKKQSGNDDSQLQIPSPQRLTPLETSWSNMNESSDLFMGGLFSNSETLRPSTNESLAEGDLNFQSVMGENSLDFESKLNEFTVHITDSNKD